MPAPAADAPEWSEVRNDSAREPDDVPNIVAEHAISRTGDTVQPLFPIIASDAARGDQEVVELPLLLPRWQAMELEAAAQRRGMTTGQMIRRYIGEMLAAQPAAAPTS